MTDYKSMFEQAVRTLAAIDEALGIGDDGAVMVVDLDLWHEGCAAMEFLIGGEEDTGECSSCKHAATVTVGPCVGCLDEVKVYRNYSPMGAI